MKRLTALTAAVVLAVAATSLMAGDKKQDRKKDGSGANCTITQAYGSCQAIRGQQRRGGGGGEGNGDRQQKRDDSCTE